MVAFTDAWSPASPGALKAHWLAFAIPIIARCGFA
jgi:hypothetical protein